MKTSGKWYRSPFVLILIVLCLLLVHFWVTVRSSKELNEHSHASIYYDYKYHYVVDIGALNSEFSREFIRGAADKAQELGIALEVKGQNSSYNATKNDFLTWAYYVHPDGVISYGGYDEDKIKVLQDAGIACCLVNNNPDRSDVMYVGPDNYEQGYILGRKLAEKYADRTLHLSVLYDKSKETGDRSRLRGFMDAVNDFPWLKVIEKRDVESGILMGMGIAEDVMLSFGEVDYLVCLDEVLLASAARGIVDLNRVNSVKASGIGTSDEIKGYIDIGLIDLSINCNGYAMGELAVEKLSDYKQRILPASEMQTITPFEMVGDVSD